MSAVQLIGHSGLFSLSLELALFLFQLRISSLAAVCGELHD